MQVFRTALILIIMFQNCSKESSGNYAFEVFSKKMNIFGIDILATEETSNDKIIHAATILAEYLDNDENGIPDNAKVVDALIKHKATLVMFKSYETMKYKKFFHSSNWPDGQTTDKRAVQDLYDDETHPNGAANGIFDASLEEVLHLITFGGYSNAYPEIFGTKRGTAVSKAVDMARGGYFAEDDPSDCDDDPNENWATGQCAVPPNGVYPNDAWYTYTDTTCSYDCMVTEYTYWAITSVLGAQSNKCDDIADEWVLCTASQVESRDNGVYRLLGDTSFALPTRLPRGDYNYTRIEIEH